MMSIPAPGIPAALCVVVVVVVVELIMVDLIFCANASVFGSKFEIFRCFPGPVIWYSLCTNY